MRRDPRNGLIYPYYSVVVWTWDAKKEEHFRKVTDEVQTLEEAIAIARKIPANADTPQVDVYAEYYDDSEKVAIKESYVSGEVFYDPRTLEDL